MSAERTVLTLFSAAAGVLDLGRGTARLLLGLPRVTSLPAASATYRGVVGRVEGGAGVADTLGACTKDAADAYAWRDITGQNVAAITGTLRHTSTWDIPNIAANGRETTTVTVTGAAAGDLVVASHDQLGATSALFVAAHVESANTVRVTVHNVSGAGINPASGTLKVLVLKV